MTTQRKAPAGATGAIQKDQLGGRSTHILPLPGEIPGTCTECFRFYMYGREDAAVSQEEQAQMAVRMFQAAQENEEEIRRQIKHDIQWFDVARARRGEAA